MLNTHGASASVLFSIVLLFLATALYAQPTTDLTRADTFIKQKQFDSALTILKNAYSNDSANFTTCVMLGNVSFFKAMYADAVKYFKRALSISGSDMAVSNSLGWSYHLLGNDSLSMRYLVMALEGSQQNNDTLLENKVLNNLGMLFYAKNALDTAEWYFNEAFRKYRSKLAEDNLNAIARLKKSGSGE